VKSKKPKETEAQKRLIRAITYWLEHDPVPTLDNIKRVAKSFGVLPKDLEEAIKMRRELEKE